MKSVTILLCFLELFCVFNSYALAAEQCANYSPFPLDPETRCCGGGFSIKVIESKYAEIDQYPWTALIEYTTMGSGLKSLCGGALISGKYVLTAASCVTEQRRAHVQPKNVILGEYDTSHEGPDCVPGATGGEDCSEGAIRIPIEKTIPHPLYNSRLRKNDIALIKMTEAANFTDFIHPICLPSSDITLGKEPIWFKFSGWGTPHGLNSIKSDVDLPFVSLEKCQLAYPNLTEDASLSRGQLCAGGEKGKDSCNGDGGMPLMYQSEKRSEVTGIVSFGRQPCGHENVPSIYTNVYEYNQWIASVIVE